MFFHDTAEEIASEKAQAKQLAELKDAALALYMMVRWELPPAKGDPARLAEAWERLRDALSLEPGRATSAGVHDEQPAEPSDEACVRAYDMWWPEQDRLPRLRKIEQIRHNPTRLQIARMIEQHMPPCAAQSRIAVEGAVGRWLDARREDFDKITESLREYGVQLDALKEERSPRWASASEPRYSRMKWPTR